MRKHVDSGDIVADALYYAFFRVVEIDELSGADRAVEWARMVVEEPDFRQAFADDLRVSAGRRLH